MKAARPPRTTRPDAGPPDSHFGDPDAPYRCQELRDDADRVILGRGSPQLTERYHLHRLSCPSCRNFHEVMVEAYRPAPSPRRRSDAELEREFQAIRAKVTDSERSSSSSWAAGLAVAAAVLLIAGLWARGLGPRAMGAPLEEIVLEDGHFARYPDAGTQIPNQVGAFAHRAQAFGRVLGGGAHLQDAQGNPAAPQSFRPGTVLRADGADAQFALLGRVLLNLEDGSQVAWTRAAHDLLEFSLDRGRVAVRYDREDGDPILQVRTPEAIVRVVGTVFTVDVDARGHTSVAVLRGQVEVLNPQSGARIATVEAGYRYDVEATTFADVGRTEVAAALPLGDGAGQSRASVPERWVVPGLPEDPERRTLSRVPAPRVIGRKRAGSPKPATPTPPARDESADLISDLVERAERDRRLEVKRSLEHCRGLYLDAESRPRAPRCLDRFMREYADEPEALEGLLLIGILRMDYAHDYQAATLRFEKFLRRAPDHPRAELAMYKLTLAAIESGEIARAMQRGRDYLERYPNGRYVGHILQRFPELRDQI